MVNSPVRKRNSVRNSSRAKSVGRMRFWLCLACFCVAWLAGVAAQAGIITSGNLNPPYPGGDGWNVGGPLAVAYTADGSMTVNYDSYVFDTSGSIGYFIDTTGTVTVTGSRSTWENTEDLSLGRSSDSGVGSLTITGGTVWVGDAASIGGAAGWLTVSDFDDSGTTGGQLYVYNGSTLTHGGSAIVGDGDGEFGWATVNGTGSSWTNGGELFVGYRGSGTLAVQNGGSVSNSGWFVVGDDGSGTLIVQNGGSISSTLAWLGYGAGSTGTATVDGAGSV